MKLTVARSGGIAGIRRTWVLEVDGRDDREHWQSVVDSLAWSQSQGRPAPDRFVYEIRCDGRRVTLADSQVDDGWRALIDLVQHDGQPVRQ